MQATKGGKATSKDVCSTKPFFPFPFTSGDPGSAITSYLLQKLQRVTNRPTLSVLVTHSWLDRSAELGHCSHQVHTTVQV